MSVPRVLHCIYDDPGNPWVGGGGSHRVWELYRRLSGDLEVTVVAGAYPGSREGVREGVAYRYVGMKRPYAASRLSYAAAASRLLAGGGYDVALYDFSVYTPIRVPASPRIGWVVHMLMGPTARERWVWPLGGLVAWRERRVLGRAARVSVTSEWLERLLRPVLAPGARVSLVRSGVGEEFFEVGRTPADHVLYYGRFDVFQKGLDVLLEAAPSFLAGGSTRLVLAGRGKDAGPLRERVSRLRGGHRVEVVENPSRREVLDLLAGALVLVHPSRFEGYPVVPAEAMAAGVPVVATSVGAVSEIVGGPSTGVLVGAGDVGALSAAVRTLLEDGDRREAMGAAARERAASFSWDAVAARHLAFVRSLLGEPGAAG